MDKVLSTIYLKVKSETQTLTKSAIAQIRLYTQVKNECHLRI